MHKMVFLILMLLVLVGCATPVKRSIEIEQPPVEYSIQHEKKGYFS
jgi:uncharacterized protein YceK